MKSKRYILNIILVLFFYVLGIMSYRYNWFPVAQIKNVKKYFIPASKPPIEVDRKDNLLITEYSKRFPVFSDRGYIDVVGDDRLDSTFVLQIPRHCSHEIRIELFRKVIIYRFLTSLNDNISFADWKKTDINVKVKGLSCVHTIVVSKIFEPGMHVLMSGGPVASSPILIKEINGKTNVPPLKIIF